MLVFDADDTLWENNIRFERVVDEFIAWLAHPTLDDPAIRAVLLEVETVNTGTHGYGSRVFVRTLRDCLERLRGRPATRAECRTIEELAAVLQSHPVELVPGAAQTLQELAGRHELALLTKGDHDEQWAKLDASGLAAHFASVHVVPEKNVGTYRDVARRLSLRPEATWMIGNSPKSDIIPARRAGWNAVLIPNDHTWILEHEELDPDDGVLQLPALTDLLAHF